MNLAPRSDLCKCPADQPDYISIACPQHFGDGFGMCVVCMAEDVINAATGARDGNGFCAPHLAQRDKAAKPKSKAPEPAKADAPEPFKMKHRDNDGCLFWVSGVNETEARDTIAGLIRTAQRHRCLCRQVPIKGFPRPPSMAPTFEVELDGAGNVAKIREKLPAGR